MANNCKYCELWTNWLPEKVDKVGGAQEITLEDAVVFNIEDSAEDASDGPAAATNGCVLVIPPSSSSEDEKETSCLIQIKCTAKQGPFSLSAIDVICAARYIEVSSGRGEYIETAQGIRIDEEIGHEKKLFIIQHSFEPTIGETKLKFVGLLKKGEIFIHSIFITLCHVRAQPFPTPLGPKIDMTKVKELMRDSKSKLPDGAQNLFESMEIYQKNMVRTQDAIPGMISQLMPGQPSAMASMMAMLGGMTLGDSARAPTCTTASVGLAPKDSGALSEQSVQINETTKIDQYSAPASENPSTKRTDSTPQDADKSSIPTMDSMLSNSMIKFAMENMEQKFLTHIRDLEEKLVTSVNSKIKESEQRIQDKLDLILEKLKNRDTKES